ncbi:MULTISPECIES: hypothetical protein [unclassified Mesorhizobium]|nr:MULTISPECIES: hypothetical protein [unclassified Mesorhizobium]
MNSSVTVDPHIEQHLTPSFVGGVSHSIAKWAVHAAAIPKRLLK